MTLYVEMRVNAHVIAELAISRVQGGAHPDSINDYTWQYMERCQGMTKREMPVHRGDVKHRYGDGAPALVAKVCAQLGARGLGER